MALLAAPVVGDWLFTCLQEPVQFLNFDYGSSRSLSDDGFPDSFQTVGGSYHSRAHCGFTLISPQYADWFLRKDMSAFFTFFCNAKIAEGARWHPREGNTVVRYTVSSVEYRYKRLPGKRHVLQELRYGSFVYPVTNPHLFQLNTHVWDIYAAYVKYRAELDRMKYEGV